MASTPYSFLITVAQDGSTTTTKYTSKLLAKAAEATAQSEGKDTYLYLEVLPAHSIVATKAEGTWIDAFGVEKEIGTGERIVQIPQGTVLHSYGETRTIYSLDGQSFTGNYTLVQIIADGNGGTTVTRTNDAGGFFYPDGFIYSTQSKILSFPWEFGPNGGTFNYGSVNSASIADGSGGVRQTGGTVIQPYGTIVSQYTEGNMDYFLKFDGVAGTYQESAEHPTGGGGGGGDSNQYGISSPIYYNTPAGDLVVGSQTYDVINGAETNFTTMYVSAGTSLAVYNWEEYFSNGEGGVYTQPWTPPPPPEEETYPFDINDPEFPEQPEITEESGITQTVGLWDENGIPMPYEYVDENGVYYFSAGSPTPSDGSFKRVYGRIYYLSRQARTVTSPTAIPNGWRNSTTVTVIGINEAAPSAPTTYSHAQIGWKYTGRQRWKMEQNRYISEQEYGLDDNYPTGPSNGNDVALFATGERCPNSNPTVYEPIYDGTKPRNSRWSFKNHTEFSFYSNGDGTAELR
jgi:hypothetical protein